MKIQDVGFIVLFAVLLGMKNRQFFLYCGLGFLMASMPLFFSWVFFTAQRFVWYAAVCFASALVIGQVYRKEKS